MLDTEYYMNYIQCDLELEVSISSVMALKSPHAGPRDIQVLQTLIVSHGDGMTTEHMMAANQLTIDVLRPESAIVDELLSELKK